MEFLKFFIFFLIFNMSMAIAASDIVLPSPYDKCDKKMDVVILSSKEKKELAQIMDENITQSIVHIADLNCNGRILKGFILSDKIRTHFQTLLVLFEKKKLADISVLKFSEPVRYKAPKAWLAQFRHRKNDHVDALSGATMTRESTISIIKQAIYLEKK